MLTPEILRELLELLTPLATGGSGILGLHTQVVLAFGTHADLLGRITMGGNAQEYITGLLRTLDEYGETSPGTRALWQFMSHLKTQVGMDKQARIDVLKPILNAPPLPAIHIASSAPRVFISYARSDGEGFAHALRASLERVMIPLWQDRVGMEGGRDWWAQITGALDKVQFMVLIMTPNAMKSEVVRKEWRYARQQGVCVYPVKGAPDLDFASLPKWMRDSHFYDLGFDPGHFEQGAEWGKFLVDLQGECKTPRVPFMVEDMPSDFVPRPEEFEALKGKLLGQDGTDPVAITAALKGAGGYGKTTLAKALCHDEDIQTAFDDGILWVTLGEKGDNLYEKVDDLIYALTGTTSSAPTLETATTKLVELLADRDVLLVIDDVWDQSHLRPFLQGGKGCARLITTRNSDTLPPHVQEQTVDAMKPSEASQLLAASIPVADPALDRALSGLARALGEWALLLKLANGVIRERIKRGETAAQALEYARRTYEKRGVLGFDGRNPSERNQAAQLSLGISFDLLHEDEKQRFAELAIFPEDFNIPLVTLERLWTAAGLDDLDTERLCETLYRYSLLLNFDLKARTIRLHDVVHKYLRDTHQGEIAGWNGRFLDAYGVKAWADLPREEPYLWDQLAYHLVEAGRVEELVKTVKDLRYLGAKTHIGGSIGSENDLLLAWNYVREDNELRLLVRQYSSISHLFQRCMLLEDVIGVLHTRLYHLFAVACEELEGWFSRPFIGGWRQLPDLPHTALIRTLAGHSRPVKAVAVSPDGSWIASLGQDQTVKVWSARTGFEMRSFQAGNARNIAISADGRRIVLGTLSSLVMLSAQDGMEIMSLRVQAGSINSFRTSPLENWIVTASTDCLLRLWDVQTGTELDVLEGHQGSVQLVEVSCNGRWIVSLSSDKSIKVWDVQTRQVRCTLGTGDRAITAIALSPDGKWVIGASGGEITAWNTESKEVAYTRKGHQDWGSSGASVTSLAFAPDGNWFVSTSSDKYLIMWRTLTGFQIRPLSGHTYGVTAVAVSPDGNWIVSGAGDNLLKLWDSHTEDKRTNRSWRYNITSIAVSTDGENLVSASLDKEVAVWNIGNGTEKHVMRGHKDWVNAVAISSNGSWAVSGSGQFGASNDNTLKIWDLRWGREIRTINGHKSGIPCVVVSPDDTKIISGDLSLSGSGLKVWDAKSGDELTTPKGDTGSNYALAISPDGAWLVSVGKKNALAIWSVQDWSIVQSLIGHKDAVNTIAMSPDGQWFVSGSSDKTLRVWSTKTWATISMLEGHTGNIRSASISPNSRLIASTAWDNTLKVWDALAGVCLHTFFAEGVLLSCAWHPDGKHIFAGGIFGLYWLRFIE